MIFGKIYKMLCYSCSSLPFTWLAVRLDAPVTPPITTYSMVLMVRYKVERGIYTHCTPICIGSDTGKLPVRPIAHKQNSGMFVSHCGILVGGLAAGTRCTVCRSLLYPLLVGVGKKLRTFAYRTLALR